MARSILQRLAGLGALRDDCRPFLSTVAEQTNVAVFPTSPLLLFDVGQPATYAANSA